MPEIDAEIYWGREGHRVDVQQPGRRLAGVVVEVSSDGVVRNWLGDS
jgi:hypothetical protein